MSHIVIYHAAMLLDAGHLSRYVFVLLPNICQPRLNTQHLNLGTTMKGEEQRVMNIKQS